MLANVVSARLWRVLAALLVLAAAVVALPRMAPAGAAPTGQVGGQVVYIYSIKVVCVPTFGNPDGVVVGGVYRTAVNVHNPTWQVAKITKWVTLAPPEGVESKISKQVTETMQPFQAFDLACRQMATEFELQGQAVPGGEGFLVIESDVELDVAAVYTSERIQNSAVGAGVGTTLDVEYVRPRVVRVGDPAQPDLTVELINPPTAVSCSGQPVQCTVRVEFTVTNASAVAVPGNVDVLIEADAVPSKTISVPVPGPGASASFAESLGPGGNCYDPDCTVTVTVDPANAIPESNEGNNADTRTDLG
jgi:hypothetical protein